jgi:sortase A
MADTTGHEWSTWTGRTSEASVVVPIVRHVHIKDLKRAEKLAKKTQPQNVKQAKPAQQMKPATMATPATPPKPPEVKQPEPTRAPETKQDTPTKPAKAAKADRPRKYFGVPVVLITSLLLLAGGFGAYVASNALATSRYSSVIDAPDTIGVLEIPRFGDSYRVPILRKVSLSSLRSGVGWYEGSANVGEYGNFALAGHRLGWGEPFSQLSTLSLGDEIWVTVGETRYTYTVITAPTRVSRTDTEVLAAVPGDPDRLPTKALITLTTAATLLPSPERIIVIGELVG